MLRQTAHKTTESFHAVALALQHPEHEAAQARRDTAVDHRCHAACVGQLIEDERILPEERDVDNVLPRLNSRLEGLITPSIRGALL